MQIFAIFSFNLRRIVPLLAGAQALHSPPAFVHSQITHVVLICGAVVQLDVAVGPGAGATLLARDDLGAQAVTVDQAHIIPNIPRVVSWREEELHLGLRRRVASGWEARRHGLPNLAVLAGTVASFKIILKVPKIN